MLNVTTKEPRRMSGFFYAQEFVDEVSLGAGWVKLYSHSPMKFQKTTGSAPRGRPMSISTWTCKLTWRKNPAGNLGSANKFIIFVV